MNVQLSRGYEFLTEPSWGQTISSNSSIDIVYMILSHDRRARDKMRELWTSHIAEPSHRCLFLVPDDGSEALRAETGDHDDIVSVNVHSADIYSDHKMSVLALLWSHQHCPLCEATALLRDNVYINTRAMGRLLERHKYESNRVYGLMYKYYTPARDKTAKHFTDKEDWPWSMYPPFLDPHAVIFTQDTLPAILHHSSNGNFLYFASL